jgi:hypothetical protein
MFIVAMAYQREGGPRATKESKKGDKETEADEND